MQQYMEKIQIFWAVVIVTLSPCLSLVTPTLFVMFVAIDLFSSSIFLKVKSIFNRFGSVIDFAVYKPCHEKTCF